MSPRGPSNKRNNKTTTKATKMKQRKKKIKRGGGGHGSAHVQNVCLCYESQGGGWVQTNAEDKGGAGRYVLEPLTEPSHLLCGFSSRHQQNPSLRRSGPRQQNQYLMIDCCVRSHAVSAREDGGLIHGNERVYGPRSGAIACVIITGSGQF